MREVSNVSHNVNLKYSHVIIFEVIYLDIVQLNPAITNPAIAKTPL